MKRILAAHTILSNLLILLLLAPAAFAGEDKILTVEGDVENPVKIHSPAPVYPALAKEERIQGRVVAKTVINTDGEVEAIEIVESLGEAFDASVREALKQWQFEPAKLNGEVVKVYYHLTINFRLDGDKSEEQPRTSY